MNQTDAAIPLFKTALEANPKIEQFWLSYIDCLIKAERVDDARRVLSEAQQSGVTAAKLQVFEVQLGFESSFSIDTPNQEFGNQLQSHQDELSPAVEFREAGKYQEAQEWLRNRIERDGKNAEALSLLSQVLLLDNKGSEAAEVLAEAASMSPELPSVCRNQARLFLKQSKIIEALEMAQLGCKHLPADPESLLVLAACLSANERDLEALPIIEELLEANSNYAEAYANRAVIKLRAKDTKGAIEDLKKTVSLKPHLNQMWQLLGSSYYQNGNLIEAIETLRIAHKNDPKNIGCMVQLAEFLRQCNEASEAISILEQARELAPEDDTVWTNLGVALQQEKRTVDAKIAYEKALALNPKSAVVMNNLGAIAKEAEEWEPAVRYFEKALEIEPFYADAHSNLGASLTALGKLGEAEASCRQAIDLKPEFSEAYVNLGASLTALGKLEEAEASYRQAIALKPDFAEAHCSLGIALSELGRPEQAETSFKQAITLRPNKFADAYDHLGFILQKRGKADEAEVCFKKWSALKPKTIPKTLSKGTIFFKQGSFEQALEAFETYDDAMSKAQVLESLYALGRVDDIYSRLEAAAGLEDENLRFAAIAAFLAERERKNTANNFCNNPMDFIHTTNISSSVEDCECFLASVIDELAYVQTKWELNTTRNGFQANVDVFRNPGEKMSTLKEIILGEIDIYYSRFKSKSCSFIKKWPSKKNIKGWHVVLKAEGHQTSHIHPTGWLSGVIYLQVVPALGRNEGAIEFSLNGQNYHHKDSPNMLFQPEAGDVLLFPSSLHHRTIPFTTDTNRIIVSFDLQP